MKKFILLPLFLISIHLLAQYSTPGNNETYSLDDLVSISGGAVTSEGEQFLFNQDILISETDTLKILSDEHIGIGEGLLWTIEGVLIIDAPNSCIIENKTDENYFLGIRFDNSSSSYLKKASISNGGGIKLIDSNLQIDSCTISFMDKEYSTSALSLTSSNPIIRNSTIQLNQGPAIGSAANASSSPQIIGCNIYLNVSSNSNTPQINLGTSDGVNPIIIENNEIRGTNDNAGGIALSTLAGGNIDALISDNFIMDNRYGIAAIGNNITGRIEYNTIVGNNIQNNPMLGGSGINFNGDESNTMIVHRNNIAFNLWGITIQGTASPNLGDDTEDSPGLNVFEDNGNNGVLYEVYNNTSGDIMAMNNYWNTESLEETEEVIFHMIDDSSLGEVFFDPIWDPVGLEELNQEDLLFYPNPTKDYIIWNGEEKEIRLFDISGKLLWNNSVLSDQKIELPHKPGVYFIVFDNRSFKIVKSE